MNIMTRPHPLEKEIALKDRALRLFSGNIHGNMGPDLYTNGGSDKYSRIIATNEDYVPYQGEVALIDEKKETIARWARDIDTVIIIGPGPAQTIANKELPILKNMAKLKTVKLIDLSAQFNAEAQNVLEKNLKSVTVESYTGDFMTVTPNENYRNALVITTGSLTNFEDASTEQFPALIAGKYLSRFQELAKPGGKILWGYDSNSDKAALEKEYDTAEIQEFILNPLNKLAATTGVAMNPGKFTYTPEFHPRSSHLAHYWTATDDQTIAIDGHTIDIFKDSRFICFSSIKLEPSRLDVVARNRGIKPYTSYKARDNGQVLHCFDCK